MTSPAAHMRYICRQIWWDTAGRLIDRYDEHAFPLTKNNAFSIISCYEHGYCRQHGTFENHRIVRAYEWLPCFDGCWMTSGILETSLGIKIHAVNHRAVGIRRLASEEQNTESIGNSHVMVREISRSACMRSSHGLRRRGPIKTYLKQLKILYGWLDMVMVDAKSTEQTA